MTQHIVLATGNQGKVNELSDLLAPLGLNVSPQSQWQVDDVEETGSTFVENAIIKARHAARITGLPCIADDSGLVVDALGGAPGIYSARYAGLPSNDSNNIDKLLQALQGIESGKRSAKFVCVLVYLRHADDPLPIICQGQWHGEILSARQGDGGFGYDPVFWVPGHNKTAAQLEKPVKNQLSHRGQALQQLVSLLQAESV
ncbi:XTP/dITP diphosphatase [Bowmanella sp. JS7-9]|uniref:dITP/XTP pyrophosphatase n=1 Tax=Pseudobowmanella zhangzhouensis TaxID=1537679 RepID=A0ABW1XHC0_9ALTE|nr:XTP/dITP diphosphatase [Bowmanella sp. JS7-9]TBX25754.1 nucleoside-triphosphate diphosphatase [Bowmanella sp. JS7-9]